MKRAALNFDPKAQLLHILEDYPGGQLLSEALQNAEDGGASRFTLLLDLRCHRVEKHAIGGPAFVLVDNGTGFGAREWKSLLNVSKSEKRSSPGEIGSFGVRAPAIVEPPCARQAITYVCEMRPRRWEAGPTFTTQTSRPFSVVAST